MISDFQIALRTILTFLDSFPYDVSFYEEKNS